MKYETVLLVLLLINVLGFISADGGPPITTRPPVTTKPPTTSPPAFCCNRCPKVKVKIKKIYKTHVFTVNIPYPVFKPLPTSVLKKCPPKYKKVSKRKCVHYVASKSTCPPGYFRVSDKSCLRIVILPKRHPEFKVKCPKGYTKYGELGCKIGESHHKKFPKLPKIITPKAPKKVELPSPKVPLVCPSGFIRKGKNHCLRVVNCPKGYKKNKAGFCIRKKVKCPKGYRRLGRQCIKDLKVCPRGYKFNAKENCCVKNCKKIYKPKCSHVKCIMRVCPQGFRTIQKPGECCPSCAPCRCPRRFNPVCGKDGVTYQNRCSAKCLGKKIKSKGACISCKGKCPKYYRPVCGKDGITYTNRCVAKKAKIEVKHSGLCKKCPKPSQSKK